MGLQAPIGPYVIEERLAMGGMAEVFVAQKKGPHGFSKRVALKRILPQYSGDPDFVSMFIDEAKVAARLDHPNLVQVFDFGEQGGDLFLAMELVDGTNVNRVLRAAAARRESIPTDMALYIAGQTAHALAYAHRMVDAEGRSLGFVHRDVSPANILLTSTGHVKLTDFGIAKVAHRSIRTEDGHVRGKLGYMSPEQVMGREMDGRSDVFTLSTVLAEMLIGKPLFGDGAELDILIRIRDADLSNLDRSERQVPKDIRRILGRGLARKPDQRPSASDLADAIDEVRRRRGMGHSAERLSRLLTQLGLVETSYGPASEAGARVTSLLDTSLLSKEAAHLVQDVGVTSPAIYRVKLLDGREIGPMSYPKLVQLFTSGQVTSDTPVSKEGGQYEPAAALVELTRFVTSPALSWRLDELSKADRSGELGPGRLVRLIFEIMRARETGVLHLWDGERRKKLYFLGGRPEFIASTDRRELLGEYLVEHEFCLRMEIEMALALLPRYGGRLGDALVGMGILRPVELFRAITGQVRARLLESFRWQKGRWAFVEGVRSHEETFPISDDGYELLRDAVAEAHPELLEAALAPVWEFVLHPVANPDVPVSAFDLPQPWLKVLTQVSSETTVGGLLGRHAADKASDLESAYRAIYLALSCGLVRTERG